MAAYLTQGISAYRDNDKALVTHGGVATDDTAFSAGQNTLNPAGGDSFITTVTASDVGNVTVDYTFEVNSGNFGGKVINTIGVLSGSAATDALSRSVRDAGLGIGVQAANDVYTISVRQTNTDQTA